MPSAGVPFGETNAPFIVDPAKPRGSSEEQKDQFGKPVGDASRPESSPRPMPGV